jgi:hypothetical protein
LDGYCTGFESAETYRLSKEHVYHSCIINLSIATLFSRNTYFLLLAVSICSFSFWFCASYGLVSLYWYIAQFEPPVTLTPSISHIVKYPAFLFGIVFFLVHLTFGFYSNWKTVPTPKSDKNTSIWANVMRGAAAGLAIFAAVLISEVSGIVGAVFSTFPAIFGTAMISVWLTSGTSVSLGSIGGLILGSTSVSLYALSIAFFLPLFSQLQGWGIALASLVAYLTSILFISYPTFVFMAWRSKKEKIEVE